MKFITSLKLLFVFSLFIIGKIANAQQFTEQTGINLTGVTLSAGAWGDYDNDGDLDILLTGNSNSGKITKIYQNNGNNSFTEQTSITNLPAIYAGSSVWGDYDSDGDLDILLTGFTNSGVISKIYKNNGNNSFTPQTSITFPGVYYSSAAWGDYDNDGDLDLTLMGTNQSVYIAVIFRNNGNETFTEQQDIHLEGALQGSIAWGDSDNDSDLDIVLSGFAYNKYIAKIYSNDGSNGFTEQTNISLPGIQAGAIVWSDYNCDGYLDFLLSGMDESGISVSKIFKNNGTIGFDEQTNINLKGVGDASVVWGDFDNNGYPDIYLTGTDENGKFITAIYNNNGNNSFTEQTNISLTAIYTGSSECGDYDNDGDLDLLITGDDSSSQHVSKIYRNESTKQNTQPNAATNLTTEVNNSVVTFKWDKATDAETTQNGLNYNLYVYESGQSNYLSSPQAFMQTDLKNGRRLFAKKGNIQWSAAGYKLNGLAPGKNYFWSVQAVDVGYKGGSFAIEQAFMLALYTPEKQSDNIIFSKLVADKITAKWAKGSGTKRAVFIKSAITGAADPVDNTTYNVNDITPNGWKCVYNGTADSVLLTGLIVGTEYLLHVCEYNGIAGNEKYLKSTAYLNPATPNTIFIEQTHTNFLNSNRSISWVDLNGDGLLDFLAPIFSAEVYKNNGNNSFTPFNANIGATDKGAFACTDYDNDGDIDILWTGTGVNNGPVLSKIYKNDGNYSFSEQTSISLPAVQRGAVAWGDYNNDGFQDILLTGLSTTGPISKIFKNNGNNTFTEQAAIVLYGLFNGSAAWGDYDKDGNLDILMNGNYKTSYSLTLVYRNNGDNTFTEQTSLSLFPAYNSSAAWGDYDNDGDLDILSSGAYLTTQIVSQIYRNDGAQGFSEQTNIKLTGVTNCSSTWADYDNDGDLDILLSGSTLSSTISKIYQNNNNGNFSEKLALYGVTSSAASWGDYDNDNDLDLVLTGKTAEIGAALAISRIYRNDGQTVNTQPSIPTGLSAGMDKNTVFFKWKPSVDNNTPGKAINYNLRIGTTPGGNEALSSQALAGGKLLLPGLNLINDTIVRLNLPVNKYYWSVQALDKAKSASAFAPEQTITIDSIQANGLSATITDNNSLIVRWKNGNGLYRAVFCRISSNSQTAKPVNGLNYHAEPVFGQGDLITNSSWCCVYNGKADSTSVVGLAQTYSYDFQVIEYILIGGLPRYFNTTGNANPGIFSSSLFSENNLNSITGVYSGTAIWGDYDNDGDLDFYEIGTPWISKIYKNNGNNQFTEQTVLSTIPVLLNAAAWGDYDNDGDLDIVSIGTETNGLVISSKIYRNMGNDNFIEQTGIALPALGLGSVSWGDYDGDGDLDILLNGSLNSIQSNIPITKIYRNNSNNTFTELTNVSLPGIMRGITKWGDYDNDGDLDILLAGTTTGTYNGATTKIFRNNGNSSFTEQTAISLIPSYNCAAAWGDYDNDGDLDILICGNGIVNNSFTVLYRNNGDNSFTERTDLVFKWITSGSVAWFDYDNDSKLDLLLSGNSRTIIYRNNGDNSFTEQTNFSLTPLTLSSVAPGDYDNDGDEDILVTGNNGGAISKIYKNNTIMKAGNYLANKKPSAPIQLSSNISPSEIKLKWNPVKLDETPNTAMTYNVSVNKLNENTQLIVPHADITNGYRKLVAMGNAQLDTSFVIKNLSAGTYNWSVQAVDQGLKGGDWSPIESFTVDPIQAYFEANLVCKGVPTQFTDKSKSDETITSWLWDFGDGGGTSTLQSPQYTYGAAGTYHVNLTIHSASFQHNVTMAVNVKSAPKALFTAPSVCQGSSMVITNNSQTVGVNNLAWTWNFGDASPDFAGQNPPPHNYLAGSYFVKLKVLADNGCSDSTKQEVFVGKIPSNLVSTSGNAIYCAGGKFTITAESYPNFKYEWRKDNIPLLDQTSNVFDAKLTGVYKVNITNLLGNCTVTSTDYAVTVNPVPSKPTLTAAENPAVYCEGNTLAISTTIVPNTNYQWLKHNSPITGATTNSIQAAETGIYRLMVSNSSGCADTSVTSVNLTINPKPAISSNLSVIGNTTFCSGGKVQLDAEYSPDYIYKWKKDGAYIVGNTNSLLADQSGSYTSEVLTLKNCSLATNPVVVAVKQSPAIPTIISPLSSILCQGETAELKVNAVTGQTYQWYLNGGALSQANSATFLAGQQGKYTIATTATNSCSTFSTDTALVKVNQISVNSSIQLSGLPNICPGQPIELSVENNSLLSYQWFKNGGNIDGAINSKLTISSGGNYTVKIMNNQCSLTSPQQPITEKIGPPVPEMFLKGSKVWYIGCSVKSGVTYTWYKNGTEIPNSNKQIIVPKPAEGTYYVQLQNGSECPSRSVDVKIPDDFKTGKFKSLEFLEGSDDNKSGIAIYPNPSHGKTTLYIENEYIGKIFINIKDISGKTIRQYYANKNESFYQEDMDLTKFGKGIYFVDVNYNDKKEIVKVLIE